jgi:hypothetical protein
VDRLELSTEGERGDRLVAIVAALLQAPHVGADRRLAVRGPGEEQIGLRILEGQPAPEHRAEGDPRHLVDPLAAGRSGAREDDLADELRLFLRDHLRDEAAQREAEEIDLIEPQRADEGDGVARHGGNRRGRPPLRSTDAAVVEGDHPMMRGDAIDDTRIPVVQNRPEVVQEDHRHAGVGPEPAEGEARAADVDRLRGGVPVGGVRDHALALTRST